MCPTSDAQYVEHDPELEVLRSFKEWLATGSSIRSAGGPTSTKLNQAQTKLSEAEKARLLTALFSPDATRKSVMRRVFPTVVYGFVAIMLIIAGLEVSGSDVTPILDSLITATPTMFDNQQNPPAIFRGGAISSWKAASEPASHPIETSVPSTSETTIEKLDAIRGQIEEISNEIAALRNIVEKSTVNQQQLETEMGVIKAYEEETRQKLLELTTGSSRSGTKPRKQIPNLGKPQTSNPPPSAAEASIRVPLH